MVFAQLLLLTARPSVRRPSLRLGLNGISVRTAVLYSAMVLRNCSGFTPSSLCANSSMVSATTLVICWILYSSRCRCFTFRSKICQANSVAGVEALSAPLGETPAGPEIARAPLGVGLEAAAGEHDRFAAQLAFDAVVADAHAADPHAVIEQAQRARAVANLDTALGGGIGEHLDEAGAAADRLDGQPAPELELALDLEGLAAVDRDEAHALAAHPAERVEAAGHQQLDQIGIGAVLRHSRHIVEKLLPRIGAEIGAGDFLLGQIGHERLDIVDSVVSDAH